MTWKERRIRMFQGLTEKNSGTTLIEMMVGILVYGAVGELIILLFLQNKLYVSIGWVLGVAVALISAYHMWWGLNKALGQGMAQAQKSMTIHNLIRYGAIVVILALVLVMDVGNPLAAVFGILGLKMGAYMQPLVHKFNKSAK